MNLPNILVNYLSYCFCDNYLSVPARLILSSLIQDFLLQSVKYCLFCCQGLSVFVQRPKSNGGPKITHLVIVYRSMEISHLVDLALNWNQWRSVVH